MSIPCCIDDNNVGANITAGAATYTEFCSSGEIERLRNFCKPFPKVIQQKAYQVLQDMIKTDVLSNDFKLTDAEMFSCIVFIAVVDARMPYGPNDPRLRSHTLTAPSVTVMDILEHGNININKLFQAMHILKAKANLSKAVKEHLTHLEKNYCMVYALYHTFHTRLCNKVFRDDNRCEGEESCVLPPMPETEGVSFRKKQTWLLFLTSKFHVMQDSQELVQHFQLLLCCLEFVLRQTPSFLLNNPYDSVRFDALNAQNLEACLLTQLASDFDLSSQETLDLRTKSTEPFLQTLLTSDGELDLERLDDEYEDIYRHEGDINELHYLSSHPLLQTQNIANGSSNGHHSVMTQGEQRPEIMTPVRAAVSSIQQLTQSVSQVGEDPSLRLLDIFKKCSKNPRRSLDAHLGRLQARFMEGFKAHKLSPDSGMSQQRFALGKRLYYKVLQAMLDREAEDLQAETLSRLLNKMVFHTSLLACALEVVITTYGQSWNCESGLMSTSSVPHAFPWLLNVFSLQAYEFYKVIASFIKYEPQLPHGVVKHLHYVEFCILDSIAWKEDSALFDALNACELGQVTPPNSSPAHTSDSSSSPGGHDGGTSTVDLFLSPVRPGYSAYHQGREATDSTVGALPDLSAPPVWRSQSLSHFLSRVCKMGFSRLSKLCSALDIVDVQHKIWTCFEYVVMKASVLVRNRHIDQIIMCSIFAMCRAVEKDVTFKSIVSEYRNLPYAEQEIYKNVYLGKGEEDSIIAFYNRIFMQNLKSYILRFSPSNAAAKPQLSPMPKQVPPSPSYSLPGRKNFLVSPLKDSGSFKTPASPGQMTPSSAFLYCFKESIGSAEKVKFQNINDMMTARGIESAKKRLNLDDTGPSTTEPKARKLLL